MSLIACRMYEDEIVHLIENDTELDEVILVENEGHCGLSRKLDDVGYPHKVLSLKKINIDLEKIEGKKITLIINMVEFGLDASPSTLRDKVYKEIEHLADKSELILLLYGLCGNVLGNVENDFESYPCIVRILKDKDGEVVDDCIGALLGGRVQYLETLKNFKGTGVYFLSPMGAANWRKLLQSSRLAPDLNDLSIAKYVFDHSGYKKVAQIKTGLSDEKKFDEHVEEFARCFDFDVVQISGGFGLIEECYKMAKSELTGNLNCKPCN
jgi:hypothetical protein